MPMVQKRSVTVLQHAFLAVLVFLTIYPFIYMLISSLKSNVQIITQFWALMPSPVHWENYDLAFRRILPCILNTLFISGTTVLGVVLVSSMSAYVFARFHFWGKEVLYVSILATMMIPGVLTLVPAFIVVRELGLLYFPPWSVILPYVAGGQVVATFILRGFLQTLPDDYFDAARVDGATELQNWWNIALPLSLPILSAVAIMNIMGTWNDFIWPLIVLSQESWRTVTVGLAYFRGDYNKVDQGKLMAANVIASIPIILLFLGTMKVFIQGIMSGGIKA